MKNKTKRKEMLIIMAEVIFISAALFIANAYMVNLEKTIIVFVISTICNVINYQLFITNNKYLSIFTGAAIFCNVPMMIVSFIALLEIATTILGEGIGLFLILGLLIFIVKNK